MSGTGGGGDDDYLAIAYRDATGGMKSMPDPGISPAQLREHLANAHLLINQLDARLTTLEPLREKVAQLLIELRDTSDSLDGRLDAFDTRVSALEQRMNLTVADAIDRLDAALKRIEELERWSHSHTSLGHVDLTVHKTLKGVECDHTGIGKPGCLVCDHMEQSR